MDNRWRVAGEYLHPDKLVILVVGNLDDLLKGNPDRPEYKLETLKDKLGGITRLPLPDPLTMQYPR